MKAKKKGRKGITFVILVVLAALILFTVVVMAANSRKPDRLPLGTFDKKVKGTAFLWSNQMLM